MFFRSTAIGIQTAVGRIGSIAGTELFGVFIDYNPSLPILIVAILLITGGLAVFLVPSIDKKIISFMCIYKGIFLNCKKLFVRGKYQSLN